MQIYHDSDVDLGVLKGKKISVLGYGAQGRAQALCFHDSGLDVTHGTKRKRTASRSLNSPMRSKVRTLS